jgi:hypothetical protein
LLGSGLPAIDSAKDQSNNREENGVTASRHESLGVLLARERSLNEATAGLQQTKAQLLHDLDTIRRLGTARIILVSALVPVKLIAAAFEVEGALKTAKDVTEMCAKIHDSIEEVRQGKDLAAVIRASIDAIADEVGEYLKKKGTKDAASLVPVIDVFYTVATEAAIS